MAERGPDTVEGDTLDAVVGPASRGAEDSDQGSDLRNGEEYGTRKTECLGNDQPEIYFKGARPQEGSHRDRLSSSAFFFQGQD